MTDWEPATAAEAALQDALRAGDQERYFHILRGVELVLPAPPQARGGAGPEGWGTWASGGRTHVLAFTSPQALRTCLTDSSIALRRMAFTELADAWPNQEWWLAVDPGLPIEGYLPAWYITQLRGAAATALPGRTLGARARIEAAAAGRGQAAPVSPKLSQPAVVGSTIERLRRGVVPAQTGVVGQATATAATLPARPELAGSAEPEILPPASSSPWSPQGAAARQTPEVIPSSDEPISPARGQVSLAGGLASSGSGQREPLPRRTASAPPAPDANTPPPTIAISRVRATPAVDEDRPPPTAEPLPAGAAEPAPARSAYGRALSEPTITTVAPARIEPRPSDRRHAPTRPDEPPTFPREREPVPSGTPRSRQVTQDLSTSSAAGVGDLAAESVLSGAADRQPAADASPLEDATDFTPVGGVEADLLSAAREGKTDGFLSTLLLATVLVPLADNAIPTLKPGDLGFVWRREDVDGVPYVMVFTSKERLANQLGDRVDSVPVRFVHLIRVWPDESWSFAVNPGTPIGATLPGAQVKALASWATEVGLSDEPVVGTAPEPIDRPVPEQPPAPIPMQKPVPASQVSYYLDRGYDRVSGFVHRAVEMDHLTSPEKIAVALGLAYPGSPFDGVSDLHLLRWSAYRPNLYRIPYGGRDESAMRAMQGWMIERAPYRGNGFAPSESGDVIAEFKVDSVRLPHGAELWRMSSSGEETLVARLDADGPRWIPAEPSLTSANGRLGSVRGSAGGVADRRSTGRANVRSRGEGTRRA